MDSADDNQTCAICLESLVTLPDPKTSFAPPSKSAIGAVVPCGHVFHRACWGRWYSAHKRRQQQQQSSSSAISSKCKCPMCNSSCDSFVQLFLGEPSSKPIAPPTSNEHDSDSIVMLAQTCHDSAKRLDRVKDKLNRYKKENKSLEIQLQQERQHMEKGFERLSERHSKDRRSWKRQQVRLQQQLTAEREANAALQAEMDRMKEQHLKEKESWKKRLVEELNQSVAKQEEHFKEVGEENVMVRAELERTRSENEAMKEEIDRTIELQVEERRAREQQMKLMQEELDKAREDRARSDAKVQRAIDGIAQMRAFHEIRKDQVQQLSKEKAALEEKIRAMTEAAEANEEVVFE